MMPPPPDADLRFVVEQYPSNDVYVIRTQSGKRLLLPAVKEFVRQVDIDAKKVIVAAPVKEGALNIVYGINHTSLAAAHRIVSSASCTTNGIVPVIAALDDAFVDNVPAVRRILGPQQQRACFRFLDRIRAGRQGRATVMSAAAIFTAAIAIVLLAVLTQAVKIVRPFQQGLVERYPNEPKHQSDLAITFNNWSFLWRKADPRRSEAHCREALAIQKERKAPIGQLLIELGYVTDRDVQEALAGQAGMRFVDLDDFAGRVRAADRLGIFTIGGGVPRNWAQQVAPYLEIRGARLGIQPRLRLLGGGLADLFRGLGAFLGRQSPMSRGGGMGDRGLGIAQIGRTSHYITASLENFTDALYAEFSNATFFRPQPRRTLLIGWTSTF